MSSPSFPEGAAEHPGPRRVALLGSTGSIGRQAVDVLAANPDAFDVVALATGSNGVVLAEQAARLKPSTVALGDDARLAALDLPPGTERLGGADALEVLATRDDVDLVVVGTGGVVSLRPVLAALRDEPARWLLWSTIGFGLFYAPMAFAVAAGPAWLLAGTWQLTILAGILLAPVLYDDERAVIPRRAVAGAAVVLAGVAVVQAEHVRAVGAEALLVGVLPVVVAAFAYPAGNRRTMELAGGRPARGIRGRGGAQRPAGHRALLRRDGARAARPGPARRGGGDAVRRGGLRGRARGAPPGRRPAVAARVGRDRADRGRHRLDRPARALSTSCAMASAGAPGFQPRPRGLPYERRHPPPL